MKHNDLYQGKYILNLFLSIQLNLLLSIVYLFMKASSYILIENFQVCPSGTLTNMKE